MWHLRLCLGEDLRSHITPVLKELQWFPAGFWTQSRGWLLLLNPKLVWNQIPIRPHFPVYEITMFLKASGSVFSVFHQMLMPTLEGAFSMAVLHLWDSWAMPAFPLTAHVLYDLQDDPLLMCFWSLKLHLLLLSLTVLFILVYWCCLWCYSATYLVSSVLIVQLIWFLLFYYTTIY